MAFGSHPLLSGASLQIERGERIGLLGRNGEGKSTLLNILSGDLKPDRGELVRTANVRVARLPQQVPTGCAETVAQIVRSGDVAHASSSDHPVERLCSLMQLDPEQPFESLSGGQKRKALLARALIGEPDVLLLDEPTNHLDLAGILWLEQFLRRFAGSLLFVTHDRAFLQQLATRILELDRGALTSWDCDYPTYLRRKEALLNAEEQQWEQFDKKLAQEEVWIRQGIKARRTRNEGRVRALEHLRLLRSQRRERGEAAKITIQQSERSGRKVITAKDVGFAYAEDASARPLLQHFSTAIMRGDKVGIIGPNGCGKTTLLNLLLGRMPAQTGEVLHGTKLEIAHFDQHRHVLDDERDVLFNVADGNEFVVVNGARRHVIGYLQDFLFSSDRVRQPVRCLSGGERNRLLLARLFTQPSNVLVLDEPTNDLDAETLELLETRLIEYEGTVLLVSHDRMFLDNICTSTLVFEEGVVREYVGGYSDWRQCVERRVPSAAGKKNDESRPLARPGAQKKLANKEREEWEQLPGRIEAMEQELHALQQRLVQPDFYRGAAEEIRLVNERIAALPALIETAYARWAVLDARR